MRTINRAIRSRRIARRGFTLVEAALAMVIVGTGVMALLQLITAGTMVNASGATLTEAVNLANNIHEISLGLPLQDPTGKTPITKESGPPTNYTRLWSMNGDTYSPPLDVTRLPIASYSKWSQNVTINTVDPANVTAVRPNNNNTDPTQGPVYPTARMTVVVKHNGQFVYQTSWLITAPNFVPQ
ncbi:MAG TPA: prepilin-type N-terminal cleavage/methylation domain-containing protein [Tepidisphaeraceae bacterium]